MVLYLYLSLIGLVVPLVSPKLACWESEEFSIREPCRVCRAKGDNQTVCRLTGFIEKVRCKKSDTVEARACQELPEVQTRIFWRFELCCAFVAALSAYFTFYRMKQLDHEHDERIQKQLSSL